MIWILLALGWPIAIHFYLRYRAMKYLNRWTSEQRERQHLAYMELLEAAFHSGRVPNVKRWPPLRLAGRTEALGETEREDERA